VTTSCTRKFILVYKSGCVESSWNVMAHGDAREGKWGGKRRMEWVASTLHTASEHGVSSITTADAHTSAASSRLNWRPRRFKWTRPFRRKTKSGFCACAITFQTQYIYNVTLRRVLVTIVAVEKQKVLHILSVCLWPSLFRTQSACAVLYCYLWPVPLYHVCPRYLINGTIFGGGGDYRTQNVI
jgi:hypothetical protein